jgi:hypothetical protein
MVKNTRNLIKRKKNNHNTSKEFKIICFSKSSVNNIPNAIWNEIFEFIPPSFPFLLAFRTISKRCFNIINNAFFWKEARNHLNFYVDVLNVKSITNFHKLIKPCIYETRNKVMEYNFSISWIKNINILSATIINLYQPECLNDLLKSLENLEDIRFERFVKFPCTYKNIQHITLTPNSFYYICQETGSILKKVPNITISFKDNHFKHDEDNTFSTNKFLLMHSKAISKLDTGYFVNVTIIDLQSVSISVSKQVNKIYYELADLFKNINILYLSKNTDNLPTPGHLRKFKNLKEIHFQDLNDIPELYIQCIRDINPNLKVISKSQIFERRKAIKFQITDKILQWIIKPDNTFNTGNFIIKYHLEDIFINLNSINQVDLVKIINHFNNINVLYYKKDMKCINFDIEKEKKRLREKRPYLNLIPIE